jgi:hypothetical protein
LRHNELHGVTTQKTALFTVTAMRASNPTKSFDFNRGDDDDHEERRHAKRFTTDANPRTAARMNNVTRQVQSYGLRLHGCPQYGK